MTRRTEARRREAVRMVRSGRTQTEVAQIVGVSRESMRRWMRAHEAGGDAALAHDPRPRGRVMAITDTQARRLMATGKRYGIDTLKGWHALAAKQGIKASLWTVRRHLMIRGAWPP